jgi:hypothetical protein
MPGLARELGVREEALAFKALTASLTTEGRASVGLGPAGINKTRLGDQARENLIAQEPLSESQAGRLRQVMIEFAIATDDLGEARLARQIADLIDPA